AGPIIPLVYKCFNRSWRIICKNWFRWQGGRISLLRRGLWLENERLVRIATTLNFSCTCYRMGEVETSVHSPINETVLNWSFPVLLDKPKAADGQGFHAFVLRYNQSARTRPF